MRNKPKLVASAVLGLFISVVISAMSLPTSADPVAEATLQAGTLIVVDPSEELGAISAELYGFNNEHGQTPNNKHGIYDPQTDTFNANLVNGLSQIKGPVIRFPGGTNSNDYDWRKAIGPQSQRGCQLSPWYTQPVSSAFGPDEVGRLAAQVGGAPSIVVNHHLGVQQAADLVEYMNAPNGTSAWADLRAANGSPEPYDVSRWEIGNEISSNPNSWVSTLPAGERAHKYAYGGTTTLSNQRLQKECTHNPADSRSDGTSDQRFFVKFPPVVPNDFTVTVAGVTWTRVSDMSAAGSADEVYELDETTGKVSFGDGQHGAIPPADSELRVSYTSGPHPGYVDYYAAMKAVDPTIKVCWGMHVRDSWEALGTNDPLDCADLSSYVFNDPLSSPIDTYDMVMNRADENGARIAAAQQSLKTSRPTASLHLYEYSMHLGRNVPGPTPGFRHSMAQGTYVASQLVDYVAAGIDSADKQPLFNLDFSQFPSKIGTTPSGVPFSAGQSAFGYYPDFVTQAAAHVSALFSHMIGDQRVSSTILNGPVRTPASVAGGDYAALKTVASTDAQGRLTVLVVNRDPNQAVTASVLPERFHYLQSAEIWTVEGDSFHAANTPQDPDAVSLDQKTENVALGGFDYEFPAHSVTAVRLTPAGPSQGVLDQTIQLDPGAPVSASAGQQITTHVQVSNTADPGTGQTTGVLTATGPDGWPVSISPGQFSLPPGQSMQAAVVVDVPVGTDPMDANVVVVARQQSDIADVGAIEIAVESLIFTDTYDGDLVGDEPANYVNIAPQGALAVESATTGRVLAVERSGAGSPISALRPFGQPVDDEVKVSFQIRADQTSAGLSVDLVDAAGNNVLRVAQATNGDWRHSNYGGIAASVLGYTAGVWYDVEYVFDGSSGTFSLSVDGVEIVSAAHKWPGSGAPAAVRLLGVATGGKFLLDNLTVTTGATQP